MPVSLKSSVVALLSKSGFTLATATIELRSLRAMRITGLLEGRGQVAALTCQRQGEYDDSNEQQSQSSDSDILTQRNLWHCLGDQNK